MMFISSCRVQFLLIFTFWNIFAGSAAATEDDGEKEVTVTMPKVFPEKDDYYMHTATELPNDRTYFITSFKPLASMEVVHHMLAYGCSDATKSATGQATCNSEQKVIYAWARGAPTLDLPDGVGYKVGLNTNVKFILLQVHYGNASAVKSDGDESGVQLHLTTKPLKKEAGIYLLSTGGRILANSTESFEAACEFTSAVTIYPFAFRTHTHVHGKLVSGYVLSKTGTNEYTKQLIGQKDPMLPQFFYPVENKNLSIKQGDIVAASCLMENKEDRNVYTGSTSKDEMCNFYIMYYQEGNRPQSSGCHSAGPPVYRWATDEKVKSILTPEEN